MFGWPEKATTDERIITQWFKGYPHANIGIKTGDPANLVGIDLDVKNGKNGLESIRIFGELPPTRTVKTPSGGLHHYYRYEKPLVSRTNLLPGVDIRATGACLIAPGSVIDGRTYAWVDESVPVANLPEHIAEFIRLKGTPRSSIPYTPRPLDSKEKEYIISSLLKKYGGPVYGHSSK
jgi:hypothetical protein